MCWQRAGDNDMRMVGNREIGLVITGCHSDGYGGLCKRLRMRRLKTASYCVKDCFLGCKKQCLKISDGAYENFK